ncbi:ATP-binding protein [Rubellimicrobium sp. CFH 75288]|uniref:ATP-binding protein n=1 Tax=Rubellimicrobium sp. CFH 75288 TaxID=2697034 RepID=UPI0014124415|nr:ATP-binding protein [Rubellimicrobium sp. CFH 75288]NAZ36875.1 HAMP domain-containing protein [Rubellimicrobium sp. CFH 75288]
MLGAWLHDRMPRSLLSRAALILLLPLVILQIAVSVAFVQRYYEAITRQMTRTLILELDYLAGRADAAPDAAAALAAARQAGDPLEIALSLPDPAPPGDSVRRYDLPGRAMATTLREGFARTRAVEVSGDRSVSVWVETVHGDMRADLSRRRIAAAAPHQLLVLTLGLGLLLMAIAYVFLRNQLRPIKRLAEAATAYGRGRIIPFRPSGAQEVRAAGTAFLAMRNRIERQAQARTTMLAGVSHDLRTPLTRLKLGLSLSEDPEAPALLRDVDDMSRMVDAFLAFARDDAEDAPEEVPLAPLVAAVVEDHRRAGRLVDLLPPEGSDPGPVSLRPLAIRRALDNLLANALAHGTRARVGIAYGERTVRLTVEDDGPGIPPDRRSEALRAFVRLDAARNLDRPGTGLGLAIVADVARSHGGALRLGDSALGGLRADLVIAR